MATSVDRDQVNGDLSRYSVTKFELFREILPDAPGATSEPANLEEAEARRQLEDKRQYPRPCLDIGCDLFAPPADAEYSYRPIAIGRVEPL